jgi:hypothetical protein
VEYIQSVRRETEHGHNCIATDDTVLWTVRSPALKETPCNIK